MQEWVEAAHIRWVLFVSAGPAGGLRLAHQGAARRTVSGDHHDPRSRGIRHDRGVAGRRRQRAQRGMTVKPTTYPSGWSSRRR
ncbi:hypothetical protein Krad_2250 [Kineococcus radiotolerans SRS30216 = ATCC BAA-149]|uniref:Uncharacterized protein n=1 Tax=Kineococcus radiotolerans (strain ATCC BAA-149 / DSM 14245 / SRS30216) TaxID=266940 RepID=A6WA92_KINRD|nr:hypothetical protein Krad_2250 [Kineococcus radiotolerans SRS30216 = ATCC BAA-149]